MIIQILAFLLINEHLWPIIGKHHPWFKRHVVTRLTIWLIDLYFDLFIIIAFIINLTNLLVLKFLFYVNPHVFLDVFNITLFLILII